MYEGFKFPTLDKIVLYAISKNRNPLKQKEIINQLPEIPKKKVSSMIKQLAEKKLIKENREWRREERMVSLNKNQLSKIRVLLKEHWESNWEDDWKNVAKI